MSLNTFNIEEYDYRIQQLWYVAKLAGCHEELEFLLDERKGHIRLIDDLSKIESKYLTEIDRLREQATKVDPIQAELDKFKRILHDAAYNPEPLIPQAAFDELMASDMSEIVRSIDGNGQCRNAEDEIALMKSWNPDYVHEEFVPDPNVDYEDISDIVPDDFSHLDKRK